VICLGASFSAPKSRRNSSLLKVRERFASSNGLSNPTKGV
jgi:hypothetical protein